MKHHDQHQQKREAKERRGGAYSRETRRNTAELLMMFLVLTLEELHCWGQWAQEICRSELSAKALPLQRQQGNDGAWILALVECSAGSDVAEVIILGSGKHREEERRD
jgi:hypothetical protein